MGKVSLVGKLLPPGCFGVFGVITGTCKPPRGSCAGFDTVLGGSSCFSTHGTVDAFHSVKFC